MSDNDTKMEPEGEVEREEKRSRSRSRSRGKEKEKEKKKKSSRDRDRDRRRRGEDRDRSRDRDRKKRERSRSPEKRRERSDSRSRRERSPSPKEEEQGSKDEYTVFVSQIHPKVDERDLFEFFSHVGRVEDIRLIRDQRTQKSKGLCYVEFSEQESVHKAVALSGQLIGGFPITVTIIESEKLKTVGDGKTMRLYVGNLHTNVSETDLEPVFEAFGPVDFVDLHKDPASGQSKGFGFVQYKNESDARAALSSLNGIEIAGQNIKVGVVEGNQEAIGSLGDLGDEAGGGVAMTAQNRADLMAKLGRETAPAAAAPAAAAIGVPRIQPTTCVIIKNMFSPAEETDPEFDLDIKEDVMEECNKFGAVKHINVDKVDPTGRVFVRMADVPSAGKLVSAFHGRWFASRQISAEFVIEQTYFMKFPEANK